MRSTLVYKMHDYYKGGTWGHLNYTGYGRKYIGDYIYYRVNFLKFSPFLSSELFFRFMILMLNRTVVIGTNSYFAHTYH